MVLFIVNILDKHGDGSFILGVYSTLEKAQESFNEYQAQDDFPDSNILSIVQRDLDDID